MIDLTTLKDWAAAGAPIIYLGATAILWREYVKLQSRYEALLVKCVEALTRVNTHLDREDHHEG